MSNTSHVCPNHWKAIVYLTSSCGATCSCANGRRTSEAQFLPNAQSTASTELEQSSSAVYLPEQTTVKSGIKVGSPALVFRAGLNKTDHQNVTTKPMCFCQTASEINTTAFAPTTFSPFSSSTPFPCSTTRGETESFQNLTYSVVLKKLVETFADDMRWIRRWFDYLYNKELDRSGAPDICEFARQSFSDARHGDEMRLNSQLIKTAMFNRFGNFSEETSVVLNTQSLSSIVALAVSESPEHRRAVVKLVSDALVRASQIYQHWVNAFKQHQQLSYGRCSLSEYPYLKLSDSDDMDVISCTNDHGETFQRTRASPVCDNVLSVPEPLKSPVISSFTLPADQYTPELFTFSTPKFMSEIPNKDFRFTFSASPAALNTTDETEIVSRKAYSFVPGITDKTLLYCLNLAFHYIFSKDAYLCVPRKSNQSTVLNAVSSACTAGTPDCPSAYLKDRRRSFSDPTSSASEKLRGWRRWMARLATTLNVIVGSRTMVICVSGASGCGKSTLAHMLASLLGHGPVLSTDTIRHILRSKYTEQNNPILFASTYETASILRTLDSASNSVYLPYTLSGDEALSECLKGYLLQSRMLYDVTESSIAQVLATGQSVVVEGVHLTAEVVRRISERFPQQCIPFVVYLSQQQTHVQRLASRSPNFETAPSKNKYVKHLEAIRAIQEYLCETAGSGTTAVLVENTVLSHAVDTMHRIVVNRLHGEAD